MFFSEKISDLSKILFSRIEYFSFYKKKINNDPFIIGVSGSVSVGKSTIAYLLKELIKNHPFHPKVDLINTDGFLYPNYILQRNNLMEKKGFPDSYNTHLFLKFLSDIKKGSRDIKVPIYSHINYDVLKGKYIKIDQPDILIIEGINILYHNLHLNFNEAISNCFDFFDFFIYIDAEENDIYQWYIKRFMKLRKISSNQPGFFFHRYTKLNQKECIFLAQELWKKINLKNLQENILQSRLCASLIIRKTKKHTIEEISLKKIFFDKSFYYYKFRNFFY